MTTTIVGLLALVLASAALGGIFSLRNHSGSAEAKQKLRAAEFELKALRAETLLLRAALNAVHHVIDA